MSQDQVQLTTHRIQLNGQELDGQEHIEASLFQPSEQTRGAVLLVPGMGIPQGYYQSFCNWLASQGFLTLSFDFRGVGRSLVDRKIKVDIFDWVHHDCRAAAQTLIEAAHKHEDIPLYWIGHSLGGQIFPMVEEHTAFKKMIAVSTGSGYWGYYKQPLRSFSFLLWYFLAPVSIKMLGYFPGNKLGMVGDLPGDAMMQWRRWCLNSDYAAGVEDDWVRAAYASVLQPITNIHLKDDEYLSAKSNRSLMALYTGSIIKTLDISPDEIQEKRIGHTGFFRSRFRDSLWQDYLLAELN